MGTKEYLQMMREIKDCTFATLDGEGRPATRIIDVMRVEAVSYTHLSCTRWSHFLTYHSARFLSTFLCSGASCSPHAILYHKTVWTFHLSLWK